MLRRAQNLLKFRLERFLLRGAGSRLLVIAAWIGLLSVACGVLVEAVSGGFDTVGDAVWWAFLRLTDPGYLGDDVGTFRRVVSTFLTVAGYVVFLGALVAIMTQWLNDTIRRLESGFTPIAQNDHVLVVGWTTRSVTIFRELLHSHGRVRRFLSRHGARKLQIVLLDEIVGPELSYEIRERLGPHYRSNAITLRNGTSLRIQHLERVDFAHAAVIVVAGDDMVSPADADTATIKTLLSMSTHGRMLTEEELPIVVAEMFDARKLHVARRAYDGPIEVLASDRAISRLIVQMIRIPGVYDVYDDIFTGGEGNALYVREVGDLAGKTFGSVVGTYEDAIPIGVARKQGKSYRPVLAPGPDLTFERDDRIVLLAHGWDATLPDAGAEPLPMPEVPEEDDPDAPGPRSVSKRRILLVGWSHKAPPMLAELERYVHEPTEVDVLSTSAVEEREQMLSSYAKLERVRVTMLRGDRTMPADVRAVSPGSYDHIVVLGSDWSETREGSDARTVVSYLLLHEAIEAQGERRPTMLVELFDRSNAALVEGRGVDVLVSPLVVGRMLAQIAMRQELRAVFDQLLGSRGPDLACRPASHYRVKAGRHTFRALQGAVLRQGDVLLGIRTDGGYEINPDHDRALDLAEGTSLLVIEK